MGMTNGQLPIPGLAIADAESVELIRAWIANQGMHISLRIGAWEHSPSIDERNAWGIVLADAVKHIADALTRQGNDRIEEADWMGHFKNVQRVICKDQALLS